MEQIPIYKKVTLTIDEAAIYSGIGENKIREIIKNEKENVDFVLHNGNRNLIKRKKFEKYLLERDVI